MSPETQTVMNVLNMSYLDIHQNDEKNLRPFILFIWCSPVCWQNVQIILYTFRVKALFDSFLLRTFRTGSQWWHSLIHPRAGIFCIADTGLQKEIPREGECASFSMLHLSDLIFSETKKDAYQCVPAPLFVFLCACVCVYMYKFAY